MPRFPSIDETVCLSPHIVILGAGASKAASIRGDTKGKPIPVMNEIIDAIGLKPLLKEAGVSADTGDFEALYSGLASSEEYKPLLEEIQSRVRAYFSELQLADSPSIYDYLLLCLRKKDVIATFNWDPLLDQAYQRNLDMEELPTTLHLHGGVLVGVCLEHRFEAFIWQRCRVCGKPLIPSKLLFPVKEKKYTDDPFIAAQWEQLQDFISRGYRITIFGYSAPVTDAEARKLMLTVWTGDPVKYFSQIEVIDVKNDVELKQTWADYIERDNYTFINGDLNVFDSSIFRYPRRSCDSFAGATLRQRPWKENRIPEFKTPRELREWIKPLVEEERRYESEKIPFATDLVIR